MWALLDGKRPAADVARAMAGELDVAEDVLLADVIELLAELLERQLVVEA